jgi:hypothetical protein
MSALLLRPALAASALLALAACASPDDYYPAASYPAASPYPAGTLLTAPGAVVTYPSGTSVYYPPATAALPPRTATDPSAYDATRRNTQSVGGGMVRMGSSVPMESGGGR